MKRIIAFTGAMGSGKSTAIELLKKHTRRHVRLVKFAGPLYAIQEFMYATIGKPVPQPKDRKLLQWIGTEWGRGIDQHLWVNLWKQTTAWELEADSTSIVVCDDCRFDNEAEIVKGMGGLIVKVETSEQRRGERITLVNSGHSSELGINPLYIDFQITNDGDLTALEAQVRDLLERV